MLKMILVFLITVGLVSGVTIGFRKLTGKEKWHLTKVIGSATIFSVVAIALLSLIVFLF